MKLSSVNKKSIEERFADDPQKAERVINALGKIAGTGKRMFDKNGNLIWDTEKLMNLINQKPLWKDEIDDLSYSELEERIAYLNARKEAQAKAEIERLQNEIEEYLIKIQENKDKIEELSKLLPTNEEEESHIEPQNNEEEESHIEPQNNEE